MALEFRVLGEVGATADGEVLAAGHARQRLVLAALLLDAGRVVPADQLVTRVWGEHPPSRVANALQTYIARLRRVLQPHGGSIERRSGGYVIPLPGPDALDLNQFTSLVAEARATADDGEATRLYEQALELWQGDALLGLESAWADIVRQSLSRQRTVAELDYADRQLRRGRHGDVLGLLSRRAEEYPLDERIAAALMRALHHSGRTDEALARYRQTRTTLRDELGADPSPQLRAVHEDILAAQAPAPAAQRGWAAPVPQQLPPSPPRFTGRDDEIRRLDTLAERHPTVPITVLHGGGGMGKTALALHWAHRQATAFPDGRLYVDLRGFSPDGDPTRSDVALRGFLHALGVTGASIPADPDARAALYRTLLAGKRVLVVLDNARDTAQVTPLLPGDPGCAVVVTSRNRMTSLTTTHGATPLAVRPLPAPQARTVLTGRLGPEALAADPDAAEQLVTRCAGSPLALGILAARAAEHPGFPLASLAAELTDVRALDDGDASVSAVLSWSLRALPPQHAEVFELLGLAPGPDISVHAAANLTGLAPNAAAAVLRALERVSLVEQDAPGRYRMHDLVRLFAKTHLSLPAEERTAALRRVIGYYSGTALAANRVLHPHGISPHGIDAGHDHPHPQQLPDSDEALGWFDADHDCLLDAQRTASAQNWHRPVWQIAWAFTAYHYRRGFLHEDLAVWAAAVHAADALGEPETRVLAHRRYGLVNARTAQHDNALKHLSKALELVDLRDIRVRGIIEHDLAQAWGLHGDQGTALRHAQRSLELFLPLGNPAWEAQARNGVGWHLTLLGRHDEARPHCERALELYREENHPAIADVLDSLGLIEHHTGQHADAVRHYREALASYRETGNTYLEADTLEHLGHTHREMGDDGKARTVWQLALDLFRAQGRLAQAAAVEAALARLGTGKTWPAPR
ncbi:AfsR/SARP family transcriptional regulator [Amycolatopsis silviterrae]|uniref:BTAD domain-containing putative transcriptional regulator n=1 Tax=Amycolatopsis silviterrae TaxID=1656914 RepID=A0ABW5H7B9_9PSEU